MELRRTFGRFVVDPKPEQLADGSGWVPAFSLEENLADCVEDTTFFSRQTFSSREDTVQACYEFGRREILRRLGEPT